MLTHVAVSRNLTSLDGTVAPRDRSRRRRAAADAAAVLDGSGRADQASSDAYALWGVAFIIFAECGLFAILPGDSLLFTVGLLDGDGGYSTTTWRSSASC